MKYFLVMNPGSRSGRSRKRFEQLKGLLQEAGITYDYEVTRTMEDARVLSRMANEKGYGAVVAVGGDGTINGVINGFYDDEGNRLSNALFGVIYTGTSPDFCKSYGIPLRHEEAVARLKEPRTIRIPVGMIRLQGRGSHGDTNSGLHEVVRYFGCCANIGLGAELARRANGGIRKYLGDFPGTLFSLLVTLIRYRPVTFNYEVDGEPRETDQLYNISVGLTPYIASGIRMGNSMEGKQGHCYVMVAKALKLSNLFPLLSKVYSGKPIENTDYLEVSWGRELVAGSNKQNLEVEYDGDPAGYLPCRIRIANDPLDLVVGP